LFCLLVFSSRGLRSTTSRGELVSFTLPMIKKAVGRNYQAEDNGDKHRGQKIHVSSPKLLCSDVGSVIPSRVGGILGFWRLLSICPPPPDKGSARDVWIPRAWDCNYSGPPTPIDGNSVTFWACWQSCWQQKQPSRYLTGFVSRVLLSVRRAAGQLINNPRPGQAGLFVESRPCNSVPGNNDAASCRKLPSCRSVRRTSSHARISRKPGHMTIFRRRHHAIPPPLAKE
jgi:hypothetical protein